MSKIIRGGNLLVPGLVNVNDARFADRFDRVKSMQMSGSARQRHGFGKSNSDLLLGQVARIDTLNGSRNLELSDEFQHLAVQVLPQRRKMIRRELLLVPGVLVNILRVGVPFLLQQIAFQLIFVVFVGRYSNWIFDHELNFVEGQTSFRVSAR